MPVDHTAGALRMDRVMLGILVRLMSRLDIHSIPIDVQFKRLRHH